MRLLSALLLGAITLLGLLATACGSRADQAPTADAAELMTTGFEQNLGWGGSQPSLTTAKAHTGQAAVLASPEVPFSYTYARTLELLGLGAPPQQLELSAWALRTAAGSTARLVVQLDTSPTDEKQVFYAALPLAEAVTTFGEWHQVRLPLELPAGAVGGNQLKIYLWNDKGTSPTYLDDVVLRRVAK
jgi:hypothetical protein